MYKYNCKECNQAFEFEHKLAEDVVFCESCWEDFYQSEWDWSDDYACPSGCCKCCGCTCWMCDDYPDEEEE